MLPQASYYNDLRVQTWLCPYVKYLEVELLDQMESTFYVLLHTAYIALHNSGENKMLFSWLPPVSRALLPPVHLLCAGVPRSYVFVFFFFLPKLQTQMPVRAKKVL